MEDIVHAMAGSTVGHNLRPAAHGKAVVAIGKGRNAVGGQVVAQCQAFIVVAAPAGSHRYTDAFTSEPCSFGARIKCSPWQSTHTGAPDTPFSWLVRAHFPNTFLAISVWHCRRLRGY